MLEQIKQRAKSLTSDQKWALVIGTGLALFPIHNKWLTDITAVEGQATLFLPAIGAVIWIMGVLSFLLNNWHKIELGEKKIYVPLIIISASIGISGFINGTALFDRISPLFMGVILFSSYLVTHRLGAGIFWMLIPFVIIGAIAVIVSGTISPGNPNGGMITNYCASAGFLIFGAIVNRGKWQWLIMLTALIGVFFIGSMEGIFIIAVVGIAVLIRRDFSKKFYITVGSIASLAILWLALGYLIPLFQGNNNLEALTSILSGKEAINEQSIAALTTNRWNMWIESLQNIRIFGHGFSLSTTGGGTVHNLPLIIIHQVGILAGIAWLLVTIYCVVRTKWKYTWIAVIAMCIFDHYIWTQFGALWWCLVGASTTSNIKTDLIYKEVKV